MNGEPTLGNIMIDCDDEKRLQQFYKELLGWEIDTLYGRPGLKSPAGIIFLFCEEPDYVRPVWPEIEGKQQKQMHFDFQVEDIFEAAKRAEKLGAIRAQQQFGGIEWITLLDPAGHPFCLCKK